MAMTSSKKCESCGKKAKRDCPALGGSICTLCCGSKRGSEIDCPAECPFYPFGTANYDLWLKVDGSWRMKMLTYVAGRCGEDAVGKMAGLMMFGDPEDAGARDNAYAFALHEMLFGEPDEPGCVLADEWEAAGWKGLNNDEIVMAQRCRHAFPTIIEVRSILDEESFECVDVLDSEAEPFIAFDRSIANSATRFSLLLVWIARYPHYTRPMAGGVEIRREDLEHLLEKLRERAILDTGDSSDGGVKEYLRVDFVGACELVQDLAHERWEHMMQTLDVRRCVARYALKGPRKKILAVLNSKPDFELDADYQPEDGKSAETKQYVWLRRGESKALEERMDAAFRSEDDDESVGMVGVVKLQPNALVVEAYHGLHFDFAKEMMDKFFADLVEYQGETVVDLAKQMINREEDPGTADLPDEPSVGAEDIDDTFMRDFYEKRYKQFMDESVPMLDGMTPRAAAVDPAMRPQLIELMKLHLYNTERDRGVAAGPVDLRWVLEELGLHELL